MNDKRTARDMGELLNAPTYAGILVPVVPDLELRILRTIESQPQSFDMGAWMSDCGTVACLAGHACLIAEQLGFETLQQSYVAVCREQPPTRLDAFRCMADVTADAMWAAIGKTPPNFAAYDEFGPRDAAALADLRARVAADLEAQEGPVNP